MPYTFRMQRRDFMRGALTWGGVTFLGGARMLAEQIAMQSCAGGPLGELLATLPLHGDTARRTAFGEVLGGSGLDARRFTDLSSLAPDRLITATRDLFLRTAAPAALDDKSPWPLPLDAIRRDARPMGAHLIECSGNTDPDNFGLLSVAEWDGLPLAEFVQNLPRTKDAAAVLVTGLDVRRNREARSPARVGSSRWRTWQAPAHSWPFA
jgi:hypothetical protein